jgi:hypothetical protein
LLQYYASDALVNAIKNLQGQKTLFFLAALLSGSVILSAQNSPAPNRADWTRA